MTLSGVASAWLGESLLPSSSAPSVGLFEAIPSLSSHVLELQDSKRHLQLGAYLTWAMLTLSDSHGSLW